jgi:hypothetical protein
MRRRWAAISVICAIVGGLVFTPLSGTARADDSAESRVAEARKECAAGRFARGIDLLAELFVQTNEPIYVYNQGRCYEENGKLELAATRFREYAAKVRATSGDQDDIAEAERRAKRLEDQLASTRAQAALQLAPPPPRPVYHRGWFWAAVGAVAAGSATAFLLATRKTEIGPPGCPNCNLSVSGVSTR